MNPTAKKSRFSSATLVMANLAAISAFSPAHVQAICTIGCSGPESPSNNAGVIFSSQVPDFSNLIADQSTPDGAKGSLLAGFSALNQGPLQGTQTPETGVAASSGGPRWNLWASTGRVNTAYRFNPRETSGHIDLGLFGVDYRPSSDLSVGVALALDKGDINLKYTNNGSLDTKGSTVSPYAAYRINPNLAVDATLGFGRSDLETSVNGGVTGDTDMRRRTASLGASYRHAIGSWLLTGRGSLLSSRSKIESYTLSDATFIPSQTMALLQLRMGLQLAYNGGWYVPTFAINQIHDIKRTNQVDVGGVSAANDRNSTQYVIGVRFKSSGQLFGGIQYAHEANRQDVKNNNLFVNVGLRF